MYRAIGERCENKLEGAGTLVAQAEKRMVIQGIKELTSPDLTFYAFDISRNG
jgi:hypothetical protein